MWLSETRMWSYSLSRRVSQLCHKDRAEDVWVMICSNESGWMLLDDDDDVLLYCVCAWAAVSTLTGEFIWMLSGERSVKGVNTRSTSYLPCMLRHEGQPCLSTWGQESISRMFASVVPQVQAVLEDLRVSEAQAPHNVSPLSRPDLTWPDPPSLTAASHQTSREHSFVQSARPTSLALREMFLTSFQNPDKNKTGLVDCERNWVFAKVWQIRTF